MAGLRGKVAAADLVPERPVSFLQSGSINPARLLKADSLAMRTNDAQNASVSYVVRKVRNRRGSFMRKRFVLTILCDKGMPAVLMVTPLKDYQAWMKIRGFDQKKLNELHKQFNQPGGRDLRAWPYKFSPREARAKITQASKFVSLMYLEKVEVSTANPNIMQLAFAPSTDGELRKPKEFEFRPEPFVKLDAEAQCAEAVAIVRCGALNMYLQRPLLVDRPTKPMDAGLWCEQVKVHVNATNAYGKNNLHHHVQLEATGQASKVTSLLEWGADANAVYGPTQMSALHMAASWHRSEIVELLLMHGADPCRADLNGLTPLHCAVIYGDLNSVRLLIQTQKFDLHQKIATVRGEMGLLDCALECEAPDGVVLSIWEHLRDCGAQDSVKNMAQIYPKPFPQMALTQFLSLVAVSTRNRWQTRVSEDKQLVTEYQPGSEGLDDIRKIRIMLEGGMDPNERDAFGRTALCICSSHQATQEILSRGGIPNHTADTGRIAEYALAYTGVHYVGIVADRCDQLRKAKIQEHEGRDPSVAVLARRMGAILAQTEVDLQGAYLRAICSASPLLEALAEGKVAKAELLLRTGTTPCVILEGFPPMRVDLSSVLPEGCEQYKRFNDTFGNFYWREIAMRILSLDFLQVSAPFLPGSRLLRSAYAKKRAFKGLNLPQHKDMEIRYSALVALLQKAEAEQFQDNLMEFPETPTSEAIAAAEERARHALTKLYQNPAIRLLEEAVKTDTPGALPEPEANRRVSDIGGRKNSERVGSDYLSMLEGVSSAGGGAGDDDRQAAEEVVKLEAALRNSRGNMLQTSIYEDEGWDEYRQRTKLTACLVDSDEDADA